MIVTDCEILQIDKVPADHATSLIRYVILVNVEPFEFRHPSDNRNESDISDLVDCFIIGLPVPMFRYLTEE